MGQIGKNSGSGGAYRGTGGRSKKRRWRSTAVVVGSTGALITPFLYFALRDDDVDYQSVCTDSLTEERVDDEVCEEEDNSHGVVGVRSSRRSHHWYYVPVGRRAPALGQKAMGGSSLAPDPGRFSVRKGGVSASGATVSRGGFGLSRGSVGG
ncbi:MAG: hypothetical protein QG608_1784 [Actinomycetota bacterium]|nr:hypothetical protein [Actinomycetota bacterium]